MFISMQKKPTVAAKPNSLNRKYGMSMSLSLPANATIHSDTDPFLYTESHPIYANSCEIMTDNVSLTSCSEGSLTPTNSDRRSSPSLTSIYSQHNNHMSLPPSPPVLPQPSPPMLHPRQRSKLPPPPPVRRTSQLSNPFAITMRTLKDAGVSTYAEIQTLRRASVVSRQNSTINDDSECCKRDLNSDIYWNINYNANANTGTTTTTNFTNNINSLHQSIIGRSVANTTANTNTTSSPINCVNRHEKTNSEYEAAKSVFENQVNRAATAATYLTAHPQSSPHSFEDEVDLSSLPLPPPPPEAFSDTEASHCGGHHYNKITNVHRQFLESLNTKLAQFFPQSSTPQSHRSPRLPKRRSMSLSRNDEHNWTSIDSFAPNRPTTATATPSQPQSSQSLQKTLRMLMPANRSNSTSSSSLFYSSSHRHQSSPDTSMKKSSHTMTSCDRESLMASLNEKLAQRQRYEAAKFARKSNYK